MARPTIVMAVEGVLQRMTTTQPIMAGVALYRSLAETHHIVLVTDYATEKEFNDWLLTEDIRSFGKIIYNDDPDLKNMKPWVRRVSQVNKLRRQGHDIHYVIDPDPDVARALLDEGFNTLLCTYKAYAYPEWLPDAQRMLRPWDELVAEQANLARIRGLDKRAEEIQDPDDN